MSKPLPEPDGDVVLQWVFDGEDGVPQFAHMYHAYATGGDGPYGSEDGKHFPEDEIVARHEAEERGKSPCPICFGEDDR